jgi:parvulin-like peptidyl-prolyl isomerase
MVHRILTLLAFVTIVLTIFLGCGEKTTKQLQNEVRLDSKTPPRVIAIISGKPITQQDMWAYLVEASGSKIFQEILLSCAIQHALKQKQLPEITQEEIDYERNVLVRTLQNNNASDLELVLSKRGYGENRLHAICQRNAGLRKLVQPKINVTEASVYRMYSLIHGPKFPVQLIVTSTLEQASQARKKIQDGELFTTVAATMSIDPSAVRGGLVVPISPADPLWPNSIRELIQTLDIGVCSPPVLIEDRWVIITVTGQPSTQTVPLRDVRQEMQQLSRLAMEQLEMDRLSKRLRTTAKSNIIDPYMKRALQQQ